MTQYYHPVAPQASRLYGFYILMLVHFMLVDYSIWQRADPQRSFIPFSDIHFFRDFSTQPLKILDPWICIPIGCSILLVISHHIIKTYRVLVISEGSTAWALFADPSHKICKFSKVQQM